MDTMLIQLMDQKAKGLLHELEELNLIKVIREGDETSKPKLSDKYRDVFSKQDAANFDNHTKSMRQE